MTGRTTARGYGWEHQKKRAQYVRQQKEEGYLTCWRCGVMIPDGEPFDLGHDDVDRSVTRGPECVPCNRATSSRAAGRRRDDGETLPPVRWFV